MKYLRYILILVLKLVGKIVGVPIFYILLPLRHKSRHIVYNYVLQNDIYLPRLLERDYEYNWLTKKYYPKNVSKKQFSLKDKGYIDYEKISSLRYCLWLCIWVWFDDDSNYDTHDGSEIKETPNKPFGTTWDLGDLRSKYPIVDGMKTFKWIARNSFYNFNYMFEEIRENDKNNFFKVITIFGYKTIWGFIPYSNSVRKGRLVFLREDFDKLDKELINEY